MRRSAWASTFAASLQLSKDGKLAIRQDNLFGPIYLRAQENAQIDD
jgi:segregation and condensation protein A